MASVAFATQAHAAPLYDVGERVDVGERFEPWTVVGVEGHTEYTRYTFERDEERTRVEVTPERGGGGRLVVQPAPGELPPADLLDAVERAVEAQVGAGSATRDTRAGGVTTTIPPPLRAARALALALVVGLLGLALYRGRKVSPSRALRALASAALAGAVGGAALIALGPDPILRTDTLRDLALGLDCASGGACVRGARTSFAGMSQGALWTRLIGWASASGAWPSGLATPLYALHALAIAVLVAARARRDGDEASNAPEIGVAQVGLPQTAAVTLAWLGASAVGGAVYDFWNPALLPLAGVLFGVALARATETRSGAWFTAAGVALALVAEGHVAAFAMLPGLAAVGSAAGRRGVEGAAAVGACLVVTTALSPGALVDNVRALSRIAPAALWAAAMVLSVVAPLFVRRRLARRDNVAWLALVPPALLVAFAVAGAALGAHQGAARYLAPAFGALAVFGVRRAASARVTLALAAGALACALAGLAGARHADDHPGLHLSDLGAIAELTQPFGGYDDLLWTLRSSDGPVAARVGGLVGRGAESPAPEVGAMWVHASHLDPRPPGDGPWESRRTRHAFVSARPFSPWVSRAHVRACVDMGAPETCVVADRSRRAGNVGVTGARYAPMDGRAFPGEAASAGELRTYLFPISASAGERTLAVMTPDGDCGAQIVAVHGLQIHSPLPAPWVDVSAGGAQRGELVLEVDAPCQQYRASIPDIAELDDDDAWLRARLERIAGAP